MKKTFAMVFAMLIAGASLAAHEGKEHLEEAKQAVQKAGAAVQGVAKDTQAVAGAAKEAVQGAVQKVENAAQAVPLDVLKESINSHWHNKIVHFPVALGFVGVLFVLFSLRWASYLWPARMTLIFALLGGLAGLLTGEDAEEGFKGTRLMETVHAHENAAKAALVFLALTLLITWFPSLKKWWWLPGLLALICLSFAGGLGGALAAS